MFKFILMLLFLLATVGCSIFSHQRSSKTVDADYPLKTLSWASEEVHQELMTASFIMHNRKLPLTILPKDHELMQPYFMDFNWTGPAWPAIEVIAADVGYFPRLVGNLPLNDPIININMTDKEATIYDLLNDINWQIQPYGGLIKIDSVAKIIALVYRSPEDLKQ